MNSILSEFIVNRLRIVSLNATKRGLLLLMLLHSFIQLALCKAPDTLPDTAKVYRNIETFSAKNKTTKFVYGTIFLPVDTSSKKRMEKKNNIESASYKNFEGKIIRKINITTLNPFGYSVSDTTVVKRSLSYKIGNAAHVKTMRITIRNLLLFHKNEPLDSLLIRESERLIRSQNYVHEVLLYCQSVGESDSVDVFIRELDLWSIIPQADISGNKNKFDFVEHNFWGTGHELYTSLTKLIAPARTGYSAQYFVPNMHNTYINSTLQSEIDVYYNKTHSAAIDRPFYSALARWAGGVKYSYTELNDSLMHDDSFVPFDSRFTTQDYWAGMAIRIYKGKTEIDRTTNLILSTRYQRINYTEQVASTYDPENIYSSGDFYLTGIGVSSRQYFKDKFIFKYGVVEDVPVGFVFGITGGYQFKQRADRTYFGARASYGANFYWGYFSPHIEYGTYIHSQHAEQSVVTAEINYYTKLLEIGRWKFRQFIKPQCTLGINRFATESVNINGSNGLSGFSSAKTIGTRKILLTLQTQSYAPWNLIGFRFGPYLVSTFGMVGNDNGGFKNRRLYSQFALGVLIKNEFLIFKSFQISLAYIPSIPEDGNNIFNINPTSTTDYGFRDFILAKPDVVDYH